MAASAAQTRLTPEEYIAFERKALPDAEIIRHEYINGELIVMYSNSPIRVLRDNPRFRQFEN